MAMKHQDYIDEIEFIGEFDGTYWNVWLDKTFWGVLPGEYSDILALWIHPEYKERVIVVDSVSKRFSACGTRIGFLISKNSKLMSEATKWCQCRLGVSTVDQAAAAAMS